MINKNILEKLKQIKKLIQNIFYWAKGLISDYKGEKLPPYGNYVIAGIHDLDNNGVLTGNFWECQKSLLVFK